MRVTLTITCLLPVLLLMWSAQNAEAQPPQSFSYQAVARDSFGIPMINKTMRVRISIRDSIASGSVLYQQMDTLMTSKIGVFTIAVGGGYAVTGSFDSIDWSSNPKYIQVEADTTLNGSFINMGISQLLSVPYALYASKSGNSTQKSSFGITLDGQGGVISTGSFGFKILPSSCIITGWSIVADVSGSIQFDLKKSGTSIIGGATKPNLTSAQRNSGGVSGWTTTSLLENDEIEFEVVSATGVTRVNLFVMVTNP